jgi:hypothetical protein
VARPRLSPIVSLGAVVGTALLVAAGAGGGGQAEPGGVQSPRPAAIVRPAEAATPIVRPAHFGDDRGWVLRGPGPDVTKRRSSRR